MTKQKQKQAVEELVQYWIKKGVLNNKEITSNAITTEKTLAGKILRMIELKVIKRNETIPARLLLRSAQFRIQSVKDKSKLDHFGVYCEWNSDFNFAVDVIRYKKDMWEDWKEQTNVWLTLMNKKRATPTERRNARPTIDRIKSDKEIGYRLENIQCLSKFDNDRKASSTPCNVLIIKDIKIQGILEFNSKKEMCKKLIEAGVPINVSNIKFDTGIIQEVGNGYSLLLQSKRGEVPPTDEPLYELVINHRREKYDEDTGEVIEVLGHWQYRFNVGGLRVNRKPIAAGQ
jgi:hypothetical protein